MSVREFLIGVVLGLLVNECTDISPFLAKKLVRWAAYRWTAHPDVAEAYAEEWSAVIAERPGKLFRLATAAMFAGGAVGRWVLRRLAAFGSTVQRSIYGRLIYAVFLLWRAGFKLFWLELPLRKVTLPLLLLIAAAGAVVTAYVLPSWLSLILGSVGLVASHLLLYVIVKGYSKYMMRRYCIPEQGPRS